MLVGGGRGGGEREMADTDAMHWYEAHSKSPKNLCLEKSAGAGLELVRRVLDVVGCSHVCRRL